MQQPAHLLVLGECPLYPLATHILLVPSKHVFQVAVSNWLVLSMATISSLSGRLSVWPSCCVTSVAVRPHLLFTSHQLCRGSHSLVREACPSSYKEQTQKLLQLKTTLKEKKRERKVGLESRSSHSLNIHTYTCTHCTGTSTYMHTHTCTYINTHAKCKHTHTHIHTLNHMHMYTCTHIHRHIFIHIHTHVYTHICRYTQT